MKLNFKSMFILIVLLSFALLLSSVPKAECQERRGYEILYQSDVLAKSWDVWYKVGISRDGNVIAVLTISSPDGMTISEVVVNIFHKKGDSYHMEHPCPLTEYIDVRSPYLISDSIEVSPDGSRILVGIVIGVNPRIGESHYVMYIFVLCMEGKVLWYKPLDVTYNGQVKFVSDGDYIVFMDYGKAYVILIDPDTGDWLAEMDLHHNENAYIIYHFDTSPLKEYIAVVYDDHHRELNIELLKIVQAGGEIHITPEWKHDLGPVGTSHEKVLVTDGGRFVIVKWAPKGSGFPYHLCVIERDGKPLWDTTDHFYEAGLYCAAEKSCSLFISYSDESSNWYFGEFTLDSGEGRWSEAVIAHGWFMHCNFTCSHDGIFLFESIVDDEHMKPPFYVRCYDGSSGRMLWQYDCPRSEGYLAVSWDGKYIAVAAHDNVDRTVRVYLYILYNTVTTESKLVNVNVKVYNAYGSPFGGLLVNLIDSNGRQLDEGLTDRSGYICMTARTGDINITINFNGVNIYSCQYEVTDEGEVIEVNLPYALISVLNMPSTSYASGGELSASILYALPLLSLASRRRKSVQAWVAITLAVLIAIAVSLPVYMYVAHMASRSEEFGATVFSILDVSTSDASLTVTLKNDGEYTDTLHAIYIKLGKETVRRYDENTPVLVIIDGIPTTKTLGEIKLQPQASITIMFPSILENGVRYTLKIVGRRNSIAMTEVIGT